MATEKDETKQAEKPAEPTARKPHGAKEYERLTTFIGELKAEGGYVFPLEPERGRVLIGDAGHIAAVNYERAEKNQEPLSDAEALGETPKLYE